MIIYQINNAFSRACSGSTILPRSPAPGDVAVAIGWDGSCLYEQDGQWAEAAELRPDTAERYAPATRFVGRPDSDTGYHVHMVRHRPGTAIARAAYPVVCRDGEWQRAGRTVDARTLPAGALDALGVAVSIDGPKASQTSV